MPPKKQIYSMELVFKDKPAILTILIDERDNSTTIMVTDKSGRVIEEFYNKPPAKK